MSYHWSNMAVMPLASGLLLLGIFIACLKYRRRPEAVAIAGVNLFASLWCLGYVCELSAADIETAIFWANIQYLGIPHIGPSVMLFGLLYSRRLQEIPRWLLYTSYIPGILTTIVVFSNDLHELHRRNLKLFLGDGFAALVFDKGPWYVLAVVMSYGQLIIGIAMVARFSRHANTFFRKQAQILLLGLIAPLVGNALFVLDLTPVKGYDPTPSLLGLVGFAMAGSLFKWRLFDIAPIARESVVDQVPNPVLVLDSAGVVVDVNASFRKLVAAESDFAVGRLANEVIPDTSFVTADTWSAAGRDFRVRKSEMTGMMNEPIAAIYLFEDQTESQATARAMAQARDEAMRASEAKSRFIANVSHEIRTPLNGVLGVSELLQETSLTPQQVEYLNAIQTCSQSLLNIVNDILDLSKIEAEKSPPKLAPFPIRSLVTELSATYRVLCGRRGLQFDLTLDDALPEFVITDGSKLRQIVDNLVNNAMKFTPSGRIGLAVTVVDGEQIRMEVSDTGIGIRPADQARIFDAFAQADGSDSRKYGGTGLGLAIVRELAQQLEGQVSLRSEYGTGSMFALTMPLRPADPALLPLPSPEMGEIEPLGLRVLLVEDNPTNALVMGRLLDSFGCFFTHADSGAVALDRLAISKFDVMLLDLQMPEMDGFELYGRVVELRADLPTIAVTANASREDRARCEAVGMVGFVTKPIHRARLYEALTAIRLALAS
ncbi:MAG: histidine kinase N-terminal 7TM domain-containing protein [Fimbriimonadaceae bacterium]|nr:histidine kinase N-terminal 7TM domain-containing protein [Fimbriimonadaceae bacterium]